MVLLYRANAALHELTSATCPTLAGSRLVARSLGLRLRPNGSIPAAIALTTRSQHLNRPPYAPRSRRQSPASRPASNRPASVVSAVVPIFTTTLRARTGPHRGRRSSLVVTVFTTPSARFFTLRGADPVGLLHARIGAATGQRHIHPAGVWGSQSNVISPIVTAQPGFAPNRSNSASTPSLANLSPR